MKKLIASALLVAGIVADSWAAQAPVRGRGGSLSTPSSETTQSTTVRSAVRSARSATAPVQTARSAQRTVAARAAATTQKVINSGTKVATAAKNTAVNEMCQEKYYGCMDAFCMLDNTSGGRCICSNKNAELDEILAEIEKLDQQSYQMATYGVEKIEMGDDANVAIAKANAVAAEAMNLGSERSNTRKTLDLSLWNTEVSFNDEPESDLFSSSGSVIDGKTGDALQIAAHDLCMAQIPECAPDVSMLKMLYGQKVRSDCNAYENSLKQQKNASQTKLATAERALREAALEQLRLANKYDLGQCTIEFKKCMQTTGGCGSDFAGCASVAASDNTNVNKSSKNKSGKYTIKGSVTTIDITASTYDTLVSKKPLCETVTKQCTSVADQVWDTFLRDAAPQIKSAELIAEDNARQSCIGNISSCFQKACRDNIDPNDPDGSYDLCLTRPETMLNLCKIPLNACGIDTTPSKAKKSQIWDFIVARLASMRVDSCTREVKSCLQSEDRCGSDYTQCVGLDTDTIIRMCPYDKLIGCQKKYGDTEIRGAAVYDEIANMVQGVMLNIDNAMLSKCQNAANEAMIKVCGDNENCDGLAVDNGAGKRSFKYEICQYTKIDGNNIEWNGVCRDSVDAITEAELKNPGDGVLGWAGKLSGTVYWGDIKYDCKDGENNKVPSCSFTTETEYVDNLKNKGYTIDKDTAKIIHDSVYGKEIDALENAVNMAINTIESDPTVQYCMTGRRVQGMTIGDDDKSFGKRGNGAGRFPNLTKQMRQTIALSALKTARENYNKKYDTEVARMMQDQVKSAERIDKEAAIAVAKDTCKDWAEKSTLPESEAPKVNNTGKWIAVGLIAAVAIVATVFTFGGGAIAGASAIAAIAGAEATTASIVAGSLVVATAIGGTVGAASIAAGIEVGSAKIDQWNYKENVTTTFEPSTGVCTKIRIYQNCVETKKNYCKEWEEPKEIRDEVKLL